MYYTFRCLSLPNISWTFDCKIPYLDQPRAWLVSSATRDDVINAFAISFPVLDFNGMIHAYLLKTSMMVRRYLTPRLSSEKALMSTKSADHIWSNPFTLTFLLWKRTLRGLYSSCASRLVHFPTPPPSIILRSFAKVSLENISPNCCNTFSIVPPWKTTARPR